MLNHRRSILSIAIVTVLGAWGDSRSALAAEPLRIGVPVIFSGPGAFVGAAQKRTLEMQAETAQRARAASGGARSN